MVVKNHRVAVEKKRKDLKADALEWGRKVDAEAKRISALLEPIEVHLQTEEDKVTKEKERIKAEKIRLEQERVEGIRGKIETIKSFVSIPPNMTAADIQTKITVLETVVVTPEVYQEFVNEALAAKEQTLNNLSVTLRDRQAWEDEQAKAKAESERLEKVRKEQEAEAAKLKAAQDKIDREKTALEAEKKAEQERKDREEFENRARERAIKEQKEMYEAQEREKKEREEKEAAEKARQEALKPDKDKLLTWARELSQRLLDMSPDLSTDEAKRIIFDAEKAIDKAVSLAVKNAKEL